MLLVAIGRLLDRVGRGAVFVGGYVLLLVVSPSLLVPFEGPAVLLVCLVLFGTYYAATDRVLEALASAILAGQLRASELALPVTTTSLGRLLASIVFGAVWTAFSLDVVTFGAGLIVATAITAIALARAPGRVAHA